MSFGRCRKPGVRRILVLPHLADGCRRSSNESAVGRATNHKRFIGTSLKLFRANLDDMSAAATSAMRTASRINIGRVDNSSLFFFRHCAPCGSPNGAGRFSSGATVLPD